jgi:hypothetical protein
MIPATVRIVPAIAFRPVRHAVSRHSKGPSRARPALPRNCKSDTSSGRTARRPTRKHNTNADYIPRMEDRQRRRGVGSGPRQSPRRVRSRSGSAACCAERLRLSEGLRPDQPLRSAGRLSLPAERRRKRRRAAPESQRLSAQQAAEPLFPRL